MTWYYESFLVYPHDWQHWIKRYPKVEARWVLRVVAEFHTGKYKIVRGEYSAIMATRLDDVYLDERFDTWEDAVERAHELVSTVATSHHDLTWPEAKAKIEAEQEAALF